MASLLNKSCTWGAVIRVNVNAIPSYSFSEKLKLCPLKEKHVLDSSHSLLQGKIFKRNLKLWPNSVSVGLNVPMQVRLIHTEFCKVPEFESRRQELKSSSSIASSTDVERKFTSYALILGGGAAGLSLSRDLVTAILSSMGPNAKTLSEASVEIDLSTIPEGKSVVMKWRNKPLFVKHRTAEDIARETAVNKAELRHPEDDHERVQKPQWLILIGICTHLGCVPIANAGEFHGYYCPCHGSHYDGAGRIRKGPAPFNLEVPEYKFINDNTVLVG